MLGNEVPSSPAGSTERPAFQLFSVLAGVLLIAGLTLAAYWPSLRGGFIWDDRLYLTNCDLIKAPDGLYRFWFTTDAIDYWPVSNSSLWFEWRLWGMNPAGYRVTNLLLHISVTLLIWRLLKRLSIPGAFLAALLFAVHPVNVETVAWIAQRKSLLAMVFLLVSILCYLRREEAQAASDEGRREVVSGWLWYGLSLFAYLLAMLSKGSVAFLPVVLLGIVWWRRRSIPWADVARIIPFFAVACGLSLVNIWFQKQHSGTGIRFATFDQRLAGAGAVPWFYLSKTLLPIDLSFVYPLWHIRPANLLWCLPLGVFATATVFLLRNRMSLWGRPLFFAWAVFCVALLPVAGFADVYFMKFSLVADHYQYHALVAVAALVAAGWSTWRLTAVGVARAVPMLVAVLVIGTLTVLTAQQSNNYRDAGILWQTTLQLNPDCSVAHVNLGVLQADAKNLSEAIDHFLAALRLDPTDAEAHHDLGTIYFQMGHTADAIDHYQQALQFGPDSAETQNNLGVALAQIGRPQDAIGHFEQALRLDPKLVDTRFALGRALVDAGRLQDAIGQFTVGLQARPENATAQFNLAVIYDTLHRRAEARVAAQKALELATQQGQTDLARQVQTWLAAPSSKP